MMPPESGAESKGTIPVALPTGTVTFLFSDIEGSTQRWESHRAAMDAAVKRHDALMRSAIEQHNGFVFKTVGDAFCAVFARVSDAVIAAIEAQRALSAEDFSAVGGLPVRMALHTGETSERNGDYFGPAVNRAARLMSIGHGGQILLSGVTRELAHSNLPLGVSLIDLGLHRLKDLTEAEQAWQLTIDGLPAVFSPLKSLDIIPNNLPIQPTSFIGRSEELADVKARLAKAQMVTLVGGGGVGKTRVALQVGADLLDGTGGGVWFVDLARVTGAEFVLPEIASALGIQVQADRPMLEQLRQYLKAKHLLLILDNCEHVVAEASRFVAATLKDCPQVKILATSREALKVSGEHVYSVPSLAVPPGGATLSASEGLAYGAVALFVDRADAADARFAFDDSKAATVGDICRQLDGIALAIELAAARVTILSVSQLAQRLGERFRLLTGGDRTVLPRQQTMRATIDWSYELLTKDERTMFRCLSIFQGGWTLEEASDVCAGEALDEFGILDNLSSLVNKSLVAVEFSGESQRYRMLESLRQYGAEMLARFGELDSIARRHAQCYHKYVTRALNDFSAVAENVWLTAIDQEIDNIRAALDWSLVQRNAPVLGADMAQFLFAYWMDRDFREGRRWTETALHLINAEQQPVLAVGLALAMTRMIMFTAPQDAVVATEQALQAARGVAEERMLVRALQYHGEALVYKNRFDEAESILSENLTLARRLEDRFRIASTLGELARLNRKRGNLDAARKLSTEALELHVDLPINRNCALTLIDRATLEHQTGDTGRAMEFLEQVQRIAEALGDRSLALMAQSSRAYYEVRAGRAAEARTTAHNAVTYARQEFVGFGLSVAFRALAGVAMQRGELERAARLLGCERAGPAAWRWLEDMFTEESLDWILPPLREHLGRELLNQLIAEGAAWSEDQAIEEALKV